MMPKHSSQFLLKEDAGFEVAFTPVRYHKTKPKPQAKTDTKPELPASQREPLIQTLKVIAVVLAVSGIICLIRIDLIFALIGITTLLCFVCRANPRMLCALTVLMSSITIMMSSVSILRSMRY